MHNMKEKDNHVAYYNWTTIFDASTVLYYLQQSLESVGSLLIINQSRGPCKRSQ